MHSCGLAFYLLLVFCNNKVNIIFIVFSATDFNDGIFSPRILDTSFLLLFSDAPDGTLMNSSSSGLILHK